MAPTRNITVNNHIKATHWNQTTLRDIEKRCKQRFNGTRNDTSNDAEMFTIYEKDDVFYDKYKQICKWMQEKNRKSIEKAYRFNEG